MYEDFVAERIAELRKKQKISARELSLSIGQNVNYINRIENKMSLPSMQGFFYICEYFHISPKDFFDDDETHPLKVQEALQELSRLNDKQLSLMIDLAREMQSHKQAKGL